MFNITLNKRGYIMSVLLFFLISSTTYAQYCVSNGSTAFQTGIRLVTFNTINNATPAENNDYSDFTAISTTVIQSSPYNLTVNLNTAGNWTIEAMVWIDWNQDNDFLDVGESYDIGNATNTVNGATSLSPFSITVPAGASIGTTRMRVSSKWNVNPTSCETGFDGEVEDYSIIVNPSVPSPEINIQGNAITIVDGDITPSITDDTDFGNVDITASTNVNTFTIQNVGTAALNLTGVSPYIVVSGTNAADFTVTAIPTTPIASSGSTIFNITFNPSAVGLRTATLTITNDDGDENPNTFDIQGIGIDQEINILGNALAIADGDITPSATDDTDFGNVDIAAGTNVNTFTIQNTGTAALNLAGVSPYIVVSGTHAADFSVTAIPTTPIAASSSTTFDITFNPSAVGLRTATLTIANDDTDENPYIFDIQGTGLPPAPEINLQGNALTIADGDITPSVTDDTAHGIVSVGTPSAKTYTIQNTGTADLTISSITLSNGTDFSITGTPFASPVTASGSTTFEVTFNSLTEGTKTTTVTISNNDGDEATYQFDITATAEDNQATLISFKAGAAVIDMGIVPQTINNGLRPYGLIQELVSVHEIPVYWIINDSKSFVSGAVKVDQADLTITGTVGSNPASASITTDLKSGPFLIPSEFVPLAQAVIESWIATSTGVGTNKLTVYWNLDAITDAPVHGGIIYFPNVTLYPIGGDPLSALPTDIETAFYTPAGIVNGFTKKAPDELGSCDLIYVLSHHTNPDTDWSQTDINTFYDFILGGGNSWLGCHDVSLTENVLATTSDASNPIRGVNQLNFLSNGGLLPYKTLLNVSTNYPWLLDFADGADKILKHTNWFDSSNILYDITTAPNPLMQFMGENQDAMNGNSEHIYVPLNDAGSSVGGWRSTTTVSLYDPTNSQIPTRSPGRAGVVVYGPAYGNTDYGTLLYQGSHISSGNEVGNWDPEHIGELRLFANFLLESALEVTPKITIPELPFAIDECGATCVTVNAVVDNIPHPNNTYFWEYEVLSGTTTAPVTFAPDNAASTTICFPQNVGEVIFKVTLTFTSTPDGGCDNPITSKYISVVTVNEATTANAGTDQTLNCGMTSTVMSATNTGGYTGTWTIVSGLGGNITDINDPNTMFTGVNSETYILRWSITCVADDVQVSIGGDCSAIDFDGIDDNITFDDNYDFNGAFSMELWIKPSSLTGTQSIISKRDANNLTSGYDLKLVNSTLSFNWNSSGSLSSPYPLGTSRWYHVAITFDSTTYRLYIDGVEVNSSGGVVPTANSLDCIIGAMDQSVTSPFNPVNYFNGWLDELRIWNVALAVTQIRQMMNQEIGVNDDEVIGSIAPIEVSGLNWNSDLTAYYKMNQSTDISNGTIIEYTGNNITGKLRNITTSQAESTPLPYTTKADGAWNDSSASTPWTYGDTVWNIPNSLSIDGSTIIDWNIVETNHNVTIDTYANLGRERSVFGLIVSSNELQVNGDTATGTGNGLTVTHYLKIDGTLDLEGESQLIQSTGSNLDITSSGVLERDQQGTADLFTYNYWAAPVGISNTTSNNNSYTLPDILYDGTTTIVTPSAPPKPITFLTSGYNGSTGDPISIADYWVWKFSNQLSNNYSSWQHVRSTGSLSPGEGYTMKGVTDTGGAISNEQNYVFNGKPNNGDITLTLSANNDYLIGNPYASAIDANEFILDNISVGNGGRAASNIINGTLYFWEHWGGGSHNLGDYIGGYGTYTLMGGVTAISNDVRINNSGASGTKTPQQFIPVGQGFFVTADTGGSISFKNSQRIFKTEASDPSVFMKANPNKKTSAANSNTNANLITDTRPKIRFMLDSPKGYHRQLLLGADLNASNSFNKGYDALLIEDNKEDMFWIFDNNNFVIQAVDNFSDNTVFPLGVIINQEGMTTIKIDELENMPSSVDIFLYDKELEIFHDLNNYPYIINLSVGEYLNKFEIVLHNKSLSTKDKHLTGVDVHYANAIKSIIITNLNHSNINVIRMTNLLGQEIFLAKNHGSKNYIELKTKRFSSGTYIIKVVTDKGTAVKKVLID